MSSGSSRFGNLAQAVRERTASAAAGEDLQTTTAVPSPAGAGIHKPAAALASVAEGLRDRVARLETELAQQTDRNGDLERQLAHARHAVAGAGDALEEFLFLDPGQVNDPLPRDRLPGAFAGPAFDSLLADIQANGQNDAITVRRSGKQGFEIAAGRRRLEVCRLLGLQVLARVRDLDDGAMLRVQFAENERREDISALERAKWFASVRERIAISAKELAAQFGLDPSTLSLYLRLARFPDEISRRLREPQRLSVLRARRVMEAIETTPDVLRRILDALDSYARGRPPGTEIDPDEQIEVVVRAAEGRDLAFRGQRSLVPEKRHIVHCGRRVGTLTRNGGQWVFRFATSMTDDVVHAVADRLSSLVGELEESRIADLGSHQHVEEEEGRSRKSGGGSQGSNVAPK